MVNLSYTISTHNICLMSLVTSIHFKSLSTVQENPHAIICIKEIFIDKSQCKAAH